MTIAPVTFIHGIILSNSLWNEGRKVSVAEVDTYTHTVRSWNQMTCESIVEWETSIVQSCIHYTGFSICILTLTSLLGFSICNPMLTFSIRVTMHSLHGVLNLRPNVNFPYQGNPAFIAWYFQFTTLTLTFPPRATMHSLHGVLNLRPNINFLY